MKRSALALLALPLATVALALGAAPASANAADEQIAEQGVINATDVPSTWTSSPQDRSSAKKNLALAKRTKGCTQYVKFALANEAVTKAESDDFELDAQQMSNIAYVHKSAAVASKLMDALADPSVVDCLQTVLDKAIETQILKNPSTRRQVDDVDLTLSETQLDELADDQVAYEGTLTITLKDGSTNETDVALVAVQVDRVILTYSLSAPPDATEITEVFPTALTNSLVRTYEAL